MFLKGRISRVDYTTYKNRLTNVLRRSKILYFTKLFMEKVGNSKLLWSCINDILNKKSNQTVTSPLHESRLLWIHDPHHNQPPRVPHRQTVVPEKQDTVPRNTQTKVPRNNAKVPRNNPVTQSSDARARAPLENIQNSSWYNSNLSQEMYSRSSDYNPVPRTNSNDVRKQVVSSSLPPKRKRDRKHRRERRARERGKR